MADPFTLPLRPVVEKSDRPDTLPVEIAQINEQWGNFRNVNEEVLLSKLAEEEEYGGPVDSGENDDKKDMDTTERKEELYKRRAEITQFAMYTIRREKIPDKLFKFKNIEANRIML